MPVFRVQSLPDSTELFEISPEDLKHLTRVLRVGEGRDFEIILPNGPKAVAKLVSAEGRYRARLQKILPEKPETRIPLHLGIGLVRWARVEWLVEKLTELGVESVSLLTLRHCRVSKQDTLSPHKLQRLLRIAEETLKQCERSRVPEIRVLSLEEYLESLASREPLRKILFDEKLKEPKFHPDALSKNGHLDSRYAILIGPEGGFAEEERSLAEKHGFQGVSLGETLIRAETAGLYAACVLNSIL